MVIIATHVFFLENGEKVFGTGWSVYEYLRKNNIEYILVQHSLYGNQKTVIEEYKNQEISERSLGFSNLPFLIRLIQEQCINIYFGLQRKYSLFLGIDPLNAFSGVICKLLGRADKVFFYTADFATNRFSNSVLNYAYHCVDSLSAKNTDEVWNVSTRIVSYRKQNGVDLKKLHLVPNAPAFDDIKKLPYKPANRFKLVIVGNLNGSVDFNILLAIFKKLSKKYPLMQLDIIGKGQQEIEIKNLINKLHLHKKVKLHGNKNHGAVISMLSSSGIGFALYTNEKPWNKFGDSMKVREYLACGLPVIMTGIPSTSDEVKDLNAGFVITLSEKQLTDSVEKIFSDEATYKKIRKNALLLGKKYDITKILNERLGFLIS